MIECSTIVRVPIVIVVVACDFFNRKGARTQSLTRRFSSKGKSPRLVRVAGSRYQYYCGKYSPKS
jgi:hypothetical protein